MKNVSRKVLVLTKNQNRDQSAEQRLIKPISHHTYPNNKSFETEAEINTNISKT